MPPYPTVDRGAPAMLPHINLDDLYLPTFTAEDAHAYVEQHWPAYNVVPEGPWTVENAHFGTEAELLTQGLLDHAISSVNRLLCMVEVYGPCHVSEPPLRSGGAHVHSHHGLYAVFDGKTGNALGVQALRSPAAPEHAKVISRHPALPPDLSLDDPNKPAFIVDDACAYLEAWTTYLDVVVMTEDQYYQLWSLRDFTGVSVWPMESMDVSEVEAQVAERAAKGERVIGLLPANTRPDDRGFSDHHVNEQWEADHRDSRAKIRLVFRIMRPHSGTPYPKGVAWTPEDAIAVTTKYPTFGRRVRVTSVGEIRAALMTWPEAALAMRTSPHNGPAADIPVVLVVARGTFQIMPPPRIALRPPFAGCAYSVADARDGHGFTAGVGPGDILLPDTAISSVLRDADPET